MNSVLGMKIVFPGYVSAKSSLPFCDRLQNREYECSRNPHGRTRSTYGTALEFTSYYVSNTVLEFSTRHSTVCCMRSKCNTVVTLRSYVRLRERPRETKNAL
jgi:hypothetical protein